MTTTRSAPATSMFETGADAGQHAERDESNQEGSGTVSDVRIVPRPRLAKRRGRYLNTVDTGPFSYL
jgi:hypothetical protein